LFTVSKLKDSIKMIALVLAFLLTTAGALTTYAPLPAFCPAGSLVSPARGLSDDEETYRVGRKAVADVALKAWLSKANSEFSTKD
jgi:lysophospholipase